MKCEREGDLKREKNATEANKRVGGKILKIEKERKGQQKKKKT